MIRWCTAGLVLVFLALSVMCGAAAGASLAPPFKTSWRCPVQSQIDSLAAAGTTAFFATQDSYGALDISAGKLLWQKPLPEGAYSAEVETDGKTLYVALSDYKLLACDMATGEVLWSVPSTGYSSPPSLCGDMLICSLRSGTVDAVNIRTHKSVWSYDLYKGNKVSVKDRYGWEPKPLVHSGRLYVGACNGRVLCLEPKSGRLLWSVEAKRGESVGVILALVADDQRIYAAGKDGVAAFDPATGRELWREAATISGDAALALAGSRLLLAGYSGPVRAYSAADGKELWRIDLGRDKDGDSVRTSPPAVCGDLVMVGVYWMLYALDLETGRKVWEWDTNEPLGRMPLIVTSDGLLAAASDGGDTAYGEFVKLTMGDSGRKELNAQERVELARTLAAKVGHLSSQEERQFAALGKDAADALLPVFVERAAAYDRNPHVDGTMPTDAQSKAQEEFVDAAQAMEKLMTPDQTPRMIQLLDVYKDEWVRRWVTSIVAKRGDPKLAAPVFFKMFRAGETWAVSDEGQEIIWSSGLPEVTDYLVTLIKDPKADYRARWLAYINAARMGSDKAADAILLVANSKRTIPTITELMCLRKLTTQVAKPGIECDNPACNSWIKLADKKTDRHGVLWGLVACAAIGTPDDLWIVRYDGKHWTAPVFTGMTSKELGKGDWLARFVGNSKLSKDSDSDGWTDLVEKRVGTNPSAADTDGDGIKDSQDMNPLAAPRQISEQEQILQAAFEAMHQFSDGACSPCILHLPQGVRPFEVYNWGWVTIPETYGSKAALAKYAGKGMASVRFSQPNYDFSGQRKNARQSGGSPIVFNSDHTQAMVQLSTLYAPLAGTGYDISLRKIRGRWFVVKADMAWIS